MNTAAKGRRHEHEVRAMLEAAGYSVIRGASSKGEALSWKADLVATKYTDESKREVWMVLIQAKVKKR